MATTSAETTRTAFSLWRSVVAEGGSAPAYLEEHADGWTPVSWPEAAARVEALAQGLLARGVGRGDAVAVLSRTRLEWVLLDWAIMSIGAVVVGLYPTNSAKECEYILSHSETVLVFVENDEQRAKLASVYSGPVVGFDELDAFAQPDRSEPYDEPAEDDLATLIYTSGTTGPPKGCML
ncbi:MAG TPA: AMP-binding protein, partial [Gaiellaceae bacterium]|nr:AMP-binding protein [Gaiellaceae bacterium]